MLKQNKVLITGTDRMKIFDIVALFESQNNFQLQTKIIPSGEGDILSSLPEKPGIMVLILDAEWKLMLRQFSEVPKEQRPELIVIADDFYSDVMQQAMRIGARDYISYKQVADYLLPTLEQLANEVSAELGKRSGKLISIMNSKGGSGASFIAANIAHILATAKNKKVALIDLDFTFAPIADYFNIRIENNLSDAIQMDPDELDLMALKGYMTLHDSGVYVLANIPGHICISWATPSANLNQLISLALAGFDYVIVDMPNQIDPQKQAVLEYSNQVLLVVQQSLMHLRDGKLLKRMLEREWSVNSGNIMPIVNRFSKKSEITMKHVEKALNVESPWLIPNDYALVTQSIESGSLVYELNPKAKISKSFMDLVNNFEGTETESKGFFEGLFSRKSAY